MSHLERISFHIYIYARIFLIFINARFIDDRTSPRIRHNFISVALSVTSKRFHPVSLSSFSRAFPPALPPPFSCPLSLSLPPSFPLSLSLARFRIRIANETSNYHQRLPRGGPSGKTPLSLFLSSSFALTLFPSDICNQQPETTSAGNTGFPLLAVVRWK